MKIAVLHSEQTDGAPADEQDVLIQCNAVTEALMKLGHEPVEMAVDPDLTDVKKRLEAVKPDLVFNLVESLAGQDRLLHIIPSLLDVMGMPYTGAKTESLFVTTNKLLAKKALRAAGLATPDWLTLKACERGGTLPGNCIVKSVWDHASKGIDETSVVAGTDPRRLSQELTLRKEMFGGDWFAETFIAGREFNLSLLAAGEEPGCLPPAEIRFDGPMPDGIQIVGYRAKWDETSPEYAATNRHFDFSADDRPLLVKLKNMALRCWRLFALRGYGRVDFRVDSTGLPWILEVNANPCLSPDAGFAAAVAEGGLRFTQAIERIIKDTLRG